MTQPSNPPRNGAFLLERTGTRDVFAEATHEPQARRLRHKSCLLTLRCRRLGCTRVVGPTAARRAGSVLAVNGLNCLHLGCGRPPALGWSGGWGGGVGVVRVCHGTREPARGRRQDVAGAAE